MSKQKAFILLSLFLLLFLITQNCSNPWITGRGRIVFLGFEGGFYGIEADNGEHYDPTNLPANYMIDGLRVKFTMKILSDVGSIHMWGDVVEIISIKKI
ncbi:MAG: hypothetical protein OEW23_14850 [Candidatus Aminicenantes bacterium]|nr:hypothetical protein [Candidatus Aminicenantes bacterium]